MKKAMLVTLVITTRVVVEGNNIEELQDKAVAAAVEKMNRQPDQYITDENLDAVVFDDECPYGSLPQDCVA